MQPLPDANPNQPPPHAGPYPPPGYWPPYPPPPQNSTYAILSLVMGIMGLTVLGLIGAILALVFGNLAKNEIAQSQGRLTGEGYARTGVTLGWISIGIHIAVVVIILIVFLTIGLGTVMHVGR